MKRWILTELWADRPSTRLHCEEFDTRSAAEDAMWAANAKNDFLKYCVLEVKSILLPGKRLPPEIERLDE